MVHTFHANEKFEREISKIKSNEKKLFDDDFVISVYDWMLKMNLTQAEVLVYALVYQYSRPGSNSTYYGGITFIHNSLRKDRKTIICALNTLVSRGLVGKENVTFGNNVARNRYYVIMPKMPATSSHVLLYGWMFRLGLTTSELLVYAFLFAYSQPGVEAVYTGTLKRIERETGLSKMTVLRAVEALKCHNLLDTYNTKRHKAYEAMWTKDAVCVYNKRNQTIQGFNPINITYTID